MATILVNLQMRTATTAQWAASTRPLMLSELGRNSDTGEIRIGTGAALWAACDTVTRGSELAAIEDRVDTLETPRPFSSVQYNGTAVTAAAAINYTGGGLTVTQDPTNGRIIVNVPGADARERSVLGATLNAGTTTLTDFTGGGFTVDASHTVAQRWRIHCQISATGPTVGHFVKLARPTAYSITGRWTGIAVGAAAGSAVIERANVAATTGSQFGALTAAPGCVYEFTGVVTTVPGTGGTIRPQIAQATGGTSGTTVEAMEFLATRLVA